MKLTNQYKQYFLSMFVTLGLQKPALAAYEALTQNQETRTICNVSEEVLESYPSENDHRGTILIFIKDSNPVLQFVLASALKLRDYNPILVANFGSLPLETTLKYHWIEKSHLAVKRYNMTKFEREFNLPVCPIGAFLKSHYEHPTVSHLRIGDAFRYGDIDITPPAIASTRRYLQRYSLDSSSPEHNRVFRDFLLDGVMIAHAINNVLNDQNVIAGIFGEDAYVHGHIPAQVLEKQHVPAYQPVKGRVHDHISFKLGHRGNRSKDPYQHSIVDAVREYEMTEDDRKLLRAHLPQTSGESVRSTRYTPNKATGVPRSDRFTVLVLSHLLWDGALAPTDALFPDFFQWLKCTIDTLAVHPEMNVYLKAHPGEAIRGTNETLNEWLQ